MPDRRGRGFVEELTHTPLLVAAILAAHTPDENRRCKGCAIDSSLREPWPCGPHGIARKAQELIDQQTLSW